MKTRQHNQYQQNASAPHRLVGECLAKSSAYGSAKRYQEVSYYKILEWELGKAAAKQFFNADKWPLPLAITRTEVKRWKADWVIKGLGIVIEVQGKQHKEPVAFGGNPMKAIQRYERQKSIDRDKQFLCKALGLTLVVMDADELMKQSIFERLEWVEDTIWNAVTNNGKKGNSSGRSETHTDGKRNK